MFKPVFFVALVCAQSSVSFGQNMGLGGPFGMSGMMPEMMPGMPGMTNNMFGGQQQAPADVYTCINQDNQDSTHQIRLTFTDAGSSDAGSGMGPGGFNSMSQTNSDMPRTWIVSGHYQPSTVHAPVASQLRVVVTQYGRVRDGCNAAALGPAVTDSNSNFGGMGAMNPFFALQQSLLGNSQQQQRAGVLNNPVLAGGVNIYSATMSGVSSAQLSGAGVALCPSVGNNGQCFGAIVICCTIARDQVPASRLYVDNVGGQGVGGGLGGAGLGAGGFATSPGLGFAQADNGLGLALTDPNARGTMFTDPNAQPSQTRQSTATGSDPGHNAGSAAKSTGSAL